MLLNEFFQALRLAEKYLHDPAIEALSGSAARVVLAKIYEQQKLGLVVTVQHLLGASDLLAAEAVLAEALAIPEVTIGLRAASHDAYKPYDYLPWLEAHVLGRESLESRMLRTGRLRSEDRDKLAYVLPEKAHRYFAAQKGQDYLSRFWSKFGPLPVPVYYLLDTQGQASAASQKQSANERFIQQAAAWAEELHARARGPQSEQEAGDLEAAPVASCQMPQIESPGLMATVSAPPDEMRFGQFKGFPMQNIAGLSVEGGACRLQVEAHHVAIKETKKKSYIVVAELRDKTGAIATCNFFRNETRAREFIDALKGPLLVEALVTFDERYEEDLVAKITGVSAGPPLAKRQGQPDHARVELHAKTKMSAKEGIAEVKNLVQAASRLGIRALAITDRDVVQAYPEAAAAAARLPADKRPQILYGLEAEVIDDGHCIVYSSESLDDERLSEGFIALDLETTGLDSSVDQVIEVGAIHYVPIPGTRQFREVDRFSGLYNPGISLPPEVSQLTGITDFDLVNKPSFLSELSSFADFVGTLPILGHNVHFDMGFIRQTAYQVPAQDPKIKFNQILIDTLPYARAALPDERRHGLAQVAKALGIQQESHHRAEDDARVSAEIFMKLWERESVTSLAGLNRRYGHLPPSDLDQGETQMVTLLARNSLGLYHLYRLVSAAHTRYFQERPLLPASLLEYWRHGLLVGDHVTSGKIVREIITLLKTYAGDYEAARQAIDHNGFHWRRKLRPFDYLELQPPANWLPLLQEENSPLRRVEDLANLCRLHVHLAGFSKKPLVAVSNAHYIEPEDWEYRAVLLHEQKKPCAQSENYYLRTAEELLGELAFLGEDVARELVITAPEALRQLCDPELLPVPQGSYPPLIEEAEQEIQALCQEELTRLYRRSDGSLPELVSARLDKELGAIIKNGYAVMYYIAHHLVKKSNEDGFVVGSRGSVGSSFVATLLHITEVNPLPPHYRCPHCHYFEAVTDGQYGSGYDLPPRDCPDCGTPLARDGQDIPFETFLGFAGNKQPDIDLNFSGLYQAEAHRFIEEMFGRGYSFRAGTISGYAEKNSRLLARNFLADHGRRLGRAEINRLAEQVQGVKVTTGQHPGGIIVIPKDREIYDFTPIQYPANKAGEIITTHLDFNALHETILKLDILGHDDPTNLKLCQELSGIEIKDVPVPDERVMSLFKSTEALGIPPGTSDIAATIGLPEVGTMMARDMAETCGPTRFYDLVQLSGLAHGTDVWAGNARDLIVDGICTLNEVIGCRDSIMTRLIYDGIEAEEAFRIMESVRKGRGLSPAQEELMRSNPKIPEWYIASCQKIKYMFPKAHAVAYTISALRIAWFKVYHPAAYYAAGFSIRVGEFQAPNLLIPEAEIRKRREEKCHRFYQLDDEEPQGKKKFYLLEMVEEMYNRGLSFAPLSLKDSEAWRFSLNEKKEIIPPFSVIPGISVAMGESIVAARAAGPFKHRAELKERCGLGQVAMESLEAYGLLDGLPESNQMDLFKHF